MSMWIVDAVEIIFSVGLFVNAMLFVPQAIRIIRSKDAQNISLFTFAGFNIIQFFIILYGYIKHDYLLIIGYSLSFATCGSVTLLTIWFKLRKDKQLNSDKHKNSNSDSNYIVALYGAITGNELNKDAITIEHIKNIRDYYENMIAVMPGHIYWKDLNGIYLGCNNGQAKALGLKSRKEIVGKKAYETLPKSDAFLLAENDLKIMQSRNSSIIEESGVLDDGNIGTFLTHKVPLINTQNAVIGLVGISIDITEKKKMEEELLVAKIRQERLESMAVLGASVAHELRTPLGAVSAGMEGIKRYLPDLIASYKMAQQAGLDVPFIPEQAYSLLLPTFTNIVSEIQNGFTIIDMILIKASTVKIDSSALKPLSIVECINKALSRYPFTQTERQLIKFNDDNGFRIKGQEQLMIHVLFNLIKNALYYVKAANKGAITIWLELGNKFNKLHFKDTGSGMPKEIVAEIFKPFFTRSKYGTGAGLAFCKQVMQGFGGDIYCEAAIGEYAEFILKFPTALNPKS